VSELPAGRWLGLDVGSRRIGVAVSDPTGTIATPLATVENRGADAVIADLRRIAAETRVVGMVIGLPVRTGGEEGPEARAAREFASRVEAALGLPARLWDERLTTAGAERALIESGVRRERRRQIIDRIAAQMILQSYLDSRAPSAEP